MDKQQSVDMIKSFDSGDQELGASATNEFALRDDDRFKQEEDYRQGTIDTLALALHTSCHLVRTAESPRRSDHLATGSRSEAETRKRTEDVARRRLRRRSETGLERNGARSQSDERLSEDG